MTLCTFCKNNDDCIVTNMDLIRGNCTYYTPLTNADRIRAMPDEELAAEMSVRLSEDCLMCPVLQADCPVWESKDIECGQAMLQWLRSPAGGDGDE